MVEESEEKNNLKAKYKPKPEFVERIKKLIGEEDAEKFFSIAYTKTPISIRCNTLKISPDELKRRLEKIGWKIHQPFKDFPEVMIIKNKLNPGELGKTKEHLLGYYYIQEITSMLPIIALKPKAGEIFLDLCASPGSKTTQAAAMMKNKGTIIANEISLERIKILNSNLEKCGVMNTIVVHKDGGQFCKSVLKKTNLRFDKILVDAPCSGEGTLRKSPKTFLTWNEKFIKILSGKQKRLVGWAVRILKCGGEMVYSTCTLSPEENEEVVDYLVKNFKVKVEKIDLPLKTRCGVTEWEGKIYDEQIKNCVRIYPQDNNTDGFFLAKLKKVGE